MGEQEDFEQWEREGLLSSDDPDYDYVWRRTTPNWAVAIAMIGMLLGAALLGVLIHLLLP